MIAGLAGRTAQAVNEAQVARDLGYHAGLLSLAAMKGASEDELIAHCEAVAREIPLVGFYLQPAVGGIVLPVSFWRRFAAIENVVAIKIAPFNRYRTLDVVRGVVEAGAADRITLYTGNDDHIVLDLVTPFTVDGGRRARHGADQGRAARALERVGQAPVELLARIHAAVGAGPIAADLLALDSQITDCNARDLRCRQRLPWRAFAAVTRSCGVRACSKASGASIRTRRSGPASAGDRPGLPHYPHLADDAFVRANVARWLA